MDAALLSGTDADSLAVFHVAHTVALGVFQRDKRDDEVAEGFLGEVLALCGDVLKQCGVIEADFVAALLEGDAEHLLALHWLGLVGRIDLQHVVGALALGTENLKSLGSVVGGNDAIRDLTLQQVGRHGVAGVAQGHEIAITAHAVGTTGAGIGAGDRSKLFLDVVDEIHFLEGVAQGKAYGGTGGRHMLEAGCRGKTGGLLQFFHQLPTIEGVEEIDVARTAVEHFDGQLTVFHEDT